MVGGGGGGNGVIQCRHFQNGKKRNEHNFGVAVASAASRRVGGRKKGKNKGKKSPGRVSVDDDDGPYLLFFSLSCLGFPCG